MLWFWEIFQNRKLHDLGNFKIISAGQEGLIEVENWNTYILVTSNRKLFYDQKVWKVSSLKFNQKNNYIPLILTFQIHCNFVNLSTTFKGFMFSTNSELNASWTIQPCTSVVKSKNTWVFLITQVKSLIIISHDKQYIWMWIQQKTPILLANKNLQSTVCTQVRVTFSLIISYQIYF